MRILMIRQTANHAFSQLGNGMGIVATILHKAGYDIKVIDNNSQYKHYSNLELLKIIQTFMPKVVAFSISMPNALETYQVVKEIKNKFPQIILVAGGIHMKHSYMEALENGIDIVVNRDGELVVIPLFKHLENRTKLNFRKELVHVKGISFIKIDPLKQGLKQEDKFLFVSSDFPVIQNLDEVPIVNYDLFNMSDYIKNKNEPGIFFITGQRGCPFKCTFCSDEIQRNDKRAASADWMFNNVKDIFERYQSRYIIIADNNFTFPRQRAVDFCNLMIQSGLNRKIAFSCQTKVETPLDDELLVLMKKAGFKKINIGLERLESYSLKMINKNSSAHRVFEVMDSIKAADLQIGIFILIGFPFETKELLDKEREAFLRLTEYTNTFNCSILQPTPGTDYYANYPKSKEWYLDRSAFELQRAYFTNILEAYMLGQVDQDFFNLPVEVREQIKEFYLEFKKINFGTFLSNQNPVFRISLKLDLLLAQCSKLMFKFSPSLEFIVFSKIRALRFYFGTLLFGKKL